MAATNRELKREIRQQTFREDFFYRLCADRIHTPALRDILAENPEEVHYLVRHIASKVAGEEEADRLSEEVCDWIADKLGPAYPWPGNFRELEQCVRNIMVHGEYFGQQDHEQAFIEQLDAGHLTAEDVLRQYTTRIYARKRNYEETARTLKLDPRTVRKYIDPELLGRLIS